MHLAFAVQKTAPPGIEGLIVLHHHNRSFHRVQRLTAACEPLPARLDRVADAVQMRLYQIFGNGPCTAVDHKNGIVAQESLRKKLVSVAPGNGGRTPDALCSKGGGNHMQPVNVCEVPLVESSQLAFPFQRGRSYDQIVGPDHFSG